MQNRRQRNWGPRQPGRAGEAGPNRWAPRVSLGPRGSQSARANYDRYVALAQAEARAGNTIGAETYYQYAEHYFRSMSSGDQGT